MSNFPGHCGIFVSIMIACFNHASNAKHVLTVSNRLGTGVPHRFNGYFSCFVSRTCKYDNSSGLSKHLRDYTGCFSRIPFGSITHEFVIARGFRGVACHAGNNTGCAAHSNRSVGSITNVTR